MKNYCFPATFLAVYFLSACSSPSPFVSLQTTIAETQITMPTQTANPTYTLYPTYTPLPPTPYPTKNPYFESFSIRLFPGIEASLIYASETGTEFWLGFPKDATLQPARAMLIPGLSTIYAPSLVYTGDAFDLLTGLGDQMEGFKEYNYNAPISVIIKFAGDRNIGTRTLYYWTGSDWEKVESVCNFPLPTIDTSANTITTAICSPGTFAIFTKKND